mmetsp:Transcript_31692/g.78978  ORF Transcript_31692/g.78978 Transcript_31692/m.78978 type:complete len:210 (+) Transcript_31692:21-650(+)
MEGEAQLAEGVEQEEAAEQPAAEPVHTQTTLVAAEATSEQFDAPPLVRTAEDIKVCDTRKLVLRALDTKLSQQDPPGALQALEVLDKLAANILANPQEPKYLRFRANNPSISRKLLSFAGGKDILLALGFKTTVEEFEEFWVADASPTQQRCLGEARELFSRYRELLETKVENNAKLRKEKLAGLSEERKQTLAQIEADKQERRDRAWK